MDLYLKLVLDRVGDVECPEVEDVMMLLLWGVRTE